MEHENRTGKSKTNERWSHGLLMVMVIEQSKTTHRSQKRLSLHSSLFTKFKIQKSTYFFALNTGNKSAGECWQKFQKLRAPGNGQT